MRVRRGIAFLLLTLVAAGCLGGSEERPLDTTGTVYREELSFVGNERATNDTFPVPRGPTMLHVLVEGRNADPRSGYDVHVQLFDPSGKEVAECRCGNGDATASFGSGAQPEGAQGRWTVSFEPTGPARIRVTVTTS